MSRRATLVFTAAGIGLAAAVALAVTLLALSRRADSLAARGPLTVPVARRPIPPPFVMFRTLAPREAFGRVAMTSLATPSERRLTPIACARVQYAGGTGLCLVEEAIGKVVRHVLYLFDERFAFKTRLELNGIPIRARVSPDGTLAAVTTYAEEESPAGERLASESVLIDAGSGRVIGDLRTFTVANAGEHAIAEPIDITSVAFADGDRFFATLSTVSERFLVAGGVSARRLEVIGRGFANEALSPDGRRLLVKKQTGPRGYWQLLVLDLASRREVALNQGSRSIDDQVEWLDDAHVVYHDVTDEGTGIWMLPADGIAGPRLLVPDAFSPAIQR